MKKLLAPILLPIVISGCMTTPSTYETSQAHKDEQTNSDISNGFIFENKSVVVAKYLLTLAHTEKNLDKQVLGILSNYPELNDTLQRELNNINTRELELRLYPVLDNKMTAEEIIKFTYFIRSEPGKKLSSIAKVNNFSDTVKILNSLPPDQKAEFYTFFDSFYFKSAMSALQSPEAQEVLETYGEDFICDFAIRNSLELFTLLSAQERCLTNNDIQRRSREL
jgi:hypothetical protein